jgi:hypothetical protein
MLNTLTRRVTVIVASTLALVVVVALAVLNVYTVKQGTCVFSDTYQNWIEPVTAIEVHHPASQEPGFVMYAQR